MFYLFIAWSTRNIIILLNVFPALSVSDQDIVNIWSDLAVSNNEAINKKSFVGPDSLITAMTFLKMEDIRICHLINTSLDFSFTFYKQFMTTHFYYLIHAYTLCNV